VVPGSFLLGNEPPEPLHVLGRGMGRGKPRQAHLEEHAGVLQVMQGLR
jgi:hypothetical protein